MTGMSLWHRLRQPIDSLLVEIQEVKEMACSKKLLQKATVDSMFEQHFSDEAARYFEQKLDNVYLYLDSPAVERLATGQWSYIFTSYMFTISSMHCGH